MQENIVKVTVVIVRFAAALVLVPRHSRKRFSISPPRLCSRDEFPTVGRMWTLNLTGAGCCDRVSRRHLYGVTTEVPEGSSAVAFVYYHRRRRFRSVSIIFLSRFGWRRGYSLDTDHGCGIISYFSFFHCCELCSTLLGIFAAPKYERYRTLH